MSCTLHIEDDMEKADRIGMVEHSGRVGLARPEENGARVLWRDDPGYPGDLDTLVGSGQRPSDIAGLLDGGTMWPLDALRFLPPLSRPSKIICVGLNYRDHVTETAQVLPVHPEIFLRVPSSLTGDRASIRCPENAALDYEAELVAVIGSTARGVQSAAAALDHVVGYAAFNDITRRDLQFRTSQWTLGKNLDGSGAFGPWLVDARALSSGARGLRITTQLNGRIVQDASTDDLIFDVANLVAMISGVMTLEAGDIIVTGTPGGVGMARKPPLWMKPDDVVQVAIENIGILTTHIV